MLEVIGKENNDFIVKDSESGNTLKITDTFAEMFSRVEMSPANSPFLGLRSLVKRIRVMIRHKQNLKTLSLSTLEHPSERLSFS